MISISAIDAIYVIRGEIVVWCEQCSIPDFFYPKHALKLLLSLILACRLEHTHNPASVGPHLEQ